MASLQIDFLAGFNATKSNIKINGKLRDRFILSTDYSIGLAKSVRYQLNDASISLTLEFPTLDQFTQVDINLANDVYIRVELDDNILVQTAVTSTPPSYF